MTESTLLHPCRRTIDSHPDKGAKISSLEGWAEGLFELEGFSPDSFGSKHGLRAHRREDPFNRMLDVYVVLDI